MCKACRTWHVHAGTPTQTLKQNERTSAFPGTQSSSLLRMASLKQQARAGCCCTALLRKIHRPSKQVVLSAAAAQPA